MDTIMAGCIVHGVDMAPVYFRDFRCLLWPSNSTVISAFIVRPRVFSLGRRLLSSKGKEPESLYTSVPDVATWNGLPVAMHVSSFIGQSCCQTSTSYKELHKVLIKQISNNFDKKRKCDSKV